MDAVQRDPNAAYDSWGNGHDGGYDAGMRWLNSRRTRWCNVKKTMTDNESTPCDTVRHHHLACHWSACIWTWRRGVFKLNLQKSLHSAWMPIHQRNDMSSDPARNVCEFYTNLSRSTTPLHNFNPVTRVIPVVAVYSILITWPRVQENSIGGVDEKSDTLHENRRPADLSTPARITILLRPQTWRTLFPVTPL